MLDSICTQWWLQLASFFKTRRAEKAIVQGESLTQVKMASQPNEDSKKNKKWLNSLHQPISIAVKLFLGHQCPQLECFIKKFRTRGADEQLCYIVYFVMFCWQRNRNSLNWKKKKKETNSNHGDDGEVGWNLWFTLLHSTTVQNGSFIKTLMASVAH